jgi:hypothetical protein
LHHGLLATITPQKLIVVSLSEALRKYTNPPGTSEDGSHQIRDVDYI